MFRSIAATFLTVAIFGSSIIAQTPQGKPPPPAQKKDEPKKDAPKDAPKKDAPKDAPKKDAPKKDATKKESKPKPPTPGKEVSGLFKTKDESKKTLTLTIDGKEKIYKITEETKFTGPRGGTSDDRLKDDRLDKGYKIAVIPDAADDTVALEVKLPFRNQRDDGKSADKKGR